MDIILLDKSMDNDWTETRPSFRSQTVSKPMGKTLAPTDLWLDSDMTQSRTKIMPIDITERKSASEMEFSSYDNTLTKMMLVDFEPDVIRVMDGGRYKITLEMDVISLTSIAQMRLVMISAVNKEKSNVPILSAITTPGIKVGSAVINLEAGTGIKVVQSNDTIINSSRVCLSIKAIKR